MTDLLVLNLYFVPDRAATGMLLGQLCEGLARDHTIRVISGTPTYNPESSAPSPVQAARIPLFPASRANLFVRLLNYALYTFGALVRGLLAPKSRSVMAWSDPPWISWIAWLVARIKGSRLILVCQDVYPEIAFAIGGTTPPFRLRKLLGAFFSWPLRRADAVVAIGDDMRRVLEGKGIEKIHVIENWQDETKIRPTSARAFREANGWGDDDWVVMHSGNLGYSQHLEPLLRAAKLLADEKALHFALIGDGARKADLEAFARANDLRNVSFLPYQPTDRLNESLGAGDLHYVSLREEFVGLIVPSKIYGILAAGKPILSTLPKACAASDFLSAAGCALHCDAQAHAIADTLRAALKEKDRVRSLGLRGREALERGKTRSDAIARYRRVLFSEQRPDERAHSDDRARKASS